MNDQVSIQCLVTPYDETFSFSRTQNFQVLWCDPLVNFVVP